MKKIKTALISVSDKKNLKPLLTSLKKNNIKIISSGGTYKEIKKLKFQCLEVSEFTDSPEILEGRVKTLHPKIHAGILNKRNNKVHLKNLKDNNFENIDVVVVNFYPFEETLKNTNNHNKIIENIDVVALAPLAHLNTSPTFTPDCLIRRLILPTFFINKQDFNYPQNISPHLCAQKSTGSSISA